MCDHSICPVGREGIYIISKRSYIEWASPIYRICDSKYIEKHLMKYHQVLFIVPYCESLEELHRSLTGREAGVGNAVLGVPAENLTSMGKFSELRTELPPAAVGTPGTAFPTDVS